MVNLQQESEQAAFCSISRTSIKTQNRDSPGLLLCFGSGFWVSCVEGGNTSCKHSGFCRVRAWSSASVHHENPVFQAGFAAGRQVRWYLQHFVQLDKTAES